MQKKFERFLESLSITIHRRSILRVDINATIPVIEYSVEKTDDLIKFVNATYLKSPFAIRRKYERIKNYFNL